ncbi:Cof-type HAD-IIB family hydrolase [Candidatus Poribacteria bacterium]|nr:MAG: Cof-type HAD-IIB family hydrolase [Candidatus Poribacteria bacterium]
MNISCKLAAFDLDGTLLNSDNQLSQENCTALQDLEKNNIIVVLISGRMHRSILPISNQIGLQNPIISYNGGMVKHASTGEIFHHTPVPADYAMEIVSDCNEKGIHLNFCLNDELYVAEINQWSKLYETRTGVPANQVGNLSKFKDDTPTKLLIILPPDQLPTLLEEYKATYSEKLYVTQTQPEYIEFMNPDVTKGRALEALANRYGISLDSIVAFGDSYNDESLLQTAGFGIAMGNAVEPVKENAEYITATNDENGVAKAIYDVILK